MKRYKVVGTCAVADVEPGGTVSQEQLDAANARVEFLLGFHLEEIPEAPVTEVAPAPVVAKGGKQA
ncbi:MAG: hypothetical protein ABIS86_17015 [Streptosporangiaceae bacterium]